MIALRFCAIAAALAQTSCGPPAIDGGFDSANPAAKMYAIEYAARDGDRAAVMSIIEQLSSDDPAVRLLAIGALQRMTGETYGYHHYDPSWKRQEAIELWVQAANSGSLNIQPNDRPTRPSGSETAPAAAAGGPMDWIDVGVGDHHG
jgi:hypothetical protein